MTETSSATEEADSDPGGQRHYHDVGILHASLPEDEEEEYELPTNLHENDDTKSSRKSQKSVATRNKSSSSNVIDCNLGF